MPLFTRSLVGVGILLTVGMISPALAQQESAKEQQKPAETSKRTRIVLGSGSGEPGTSVVVPIYFTPADGLKVGHMKLEIKFVSRNLKFSKLERGFAAEAVNVNLVPEAKEEKNEQGLETTTLTIATSFPDQKAAKEIPGGILGYITFQINPEGRAANIKLRTSAQATALDTNQPIENLTAVDSSVDVLAPGSTPLVACFFFTH